MYPLEPNGFRFAGSGADCDALRQSAAESNPASSLDEERATQRAAADVSITLHSKLDTTVRYSGF